MLKEVQVMVRRWTVTLMTVYSMMVKLVLEDLLMVH